MHFSSGHKLKKKKGELKAILFSHTSVCVTGTTPHWFVMSAPSICTEKNKQKNYSELNKTTLFPILLFPLNPTNTHTGSFVAVNTG